MRLQGRPLQQVCHRVFARLTPMVAPAIASRRRIPLAREAREYQPGTATSVVMLDQDGCLSGRHRNDHDDGLRCRRGRDRLRGHTSGRSDHHRLRGHRSNVHDLRPGAEHPMNQFTYELALGRVAELDPGARPIVVVVSVSVVVRQCRRGQKQDDEGGKDASGHEKLLVVTGWLLMNLIQILIL